jgi:hypothetical protein
MRQRLEELSLQTLAGILAGLALLALAGLGAKLISSRNDGSRPHASTSAASRLAEEQDERARAEQATEAIRKREAEVKAHQVQVEHQQQLYVFIHALMQEPIDCAANEVLPARAIAQQVCHLGAIQATFTRLDSPDGAHSYFMERYLNSFPYEAEEVGTNCHGPFNSKGTWTDVNGVTQGAFTFRQSGGDAVILWEYHSHSVVVRATESLEQANQLCELWFEHSGEVP